MDNGNGEKVQGRTGLPEEVRQNVDRLMDQIFFGDDSLKKSMAVALGKIDHIEENMATKAEISNIKWDILKVLIPSIISLLLLVFAMLKYAD